jgi:hypothetical protein
MNGVCVCVYGKGVGRGVDIQTLKPDICTMLDQCTILGGRGITAQCTSLYTLYGADIHNRGGGHQLHQSQ